MTAKIFNIDDVALNEEQLRALQKMGTAKGQRKAATPRLKGGGRVVVVPDSWRRALKTGAHKATWAVALHLLHLDWKAGGRPFKVTNQGMAVWSVDRWKKQDVLDELEAAGLIRKEGRPGKTALVTILVR